MLKCLISKDTVEPSQSSVLLLLVERVFPPTYVSTRDVHYLVGVDA